MKSPEVCSNGERTTNDCFNLLPIPPASPCLIRASSLTTGSGNESGYPFDFSPAPFAGSIAICPALARYQTKPNASTGQMPRSPGVRIFVYTTVKNVLFSNVHWCLLWTHSPVHTIPSIVSWQKVRYAVARAAHRIGSQSYHLVGARKQQQAI